MATQYYIEMEGEYFKWDKRSMTGSRWVKTRREASRVCESTADILVRDWKKYGAKKIAVEEKPKCSQCKRSHASVKIRNFGFGLKLPCCNRCVA